MSAYSWENDIWTEYHQKSKNYRLPLKSPSCILHCPVVFWISARFLHHDRKTCSWSPFIRGVLSGDLLITADCKLRDVRWLASLLDCAVMLECFAVAGWAYAKPEIQSIILCGAHGWQLLDKLGKTWIGRVHDVSYVSFGKFQEISSFFPQRKSWISPLNEWQASVFACLLHVSAIHSLTTLNKAVIQAPYTSCRMHFDTKQNTRNTRKAKAKLPGRVVFVVVTTRVIFFDTTTEPSSLV